MRYLILGLFLIGCGGDKEETPIIKEPVAIYNEIPMPELTHRSNGGFNGETEHINENSWIYTSHTNDRCIGSLKSPCRKTMTSYNDEVASDRVIKTSIEFMVAEYNLEDPAYWAGIYQDWVRIFPLPEVLTVTNNNGVVIGKFFDTNNKSLTTKFNSINSSLDNSIKNKLTYFDSNKYTIDEDGFIFKDGNQILGANGDPVVVDLNGNHPITILKLKVFDGKLNLCHYDNSWQWGYDWGDNMDENNIDIDHSLHQENTLNGCKEIEVGVTYNIETINHDSGRFEFYVDDEKVSDSYYQTKSPTEPHVIQWGLYWSKGYNTENDPLNRIVVRMDNFRLLMLQKQ